MKNKKYLKIGSRHQHWLYRLILIVLLMALAIYFREWSIATHYLSVPTQKIPEYLYNNPDIEPLDSHLYIGADEDHQLLDETLKKIFPHGTYLLSEEEIAIEVERFVVTYLKQENNTGNATKILKEGYAICGGKSYVFRILLRKLNIPVRYAGLHYTPGLGGHDLAEVYYQESWHLFDPTYGIFVYSNSSYDKGGRILPLAELKANPQAGFILQVADPIWTGQYLQELKNYGVQPLRRDYLAQFTQDFDQYWRNEIKSAFPVAYGANSWISLPVDIDLRNRDYQAYGTKDGSHIDMAIHDIRFKGFGYLGKSVDVPGVYNTWTIKVDAPRSVTIKYWAARQPYSEMEIVRLRSAAIKSIEKNEDNLTIKLEILDNPGIFLAIVPEGSFTVDAIEVFKE